MVAIVAPLVAGPASFAVILFVGENPHYADGFVGFERVVLENVVAESESA